MTALERRHFHSFPFDTGAAAAPRQEPVAMRGESWSVERVALLRRLWAQGATAEVIGARLGGLSRSAVLGKVFRLRLRGETAAGAEKARQETDAKSPTNEIAPVRRRRRQPRGPQVPSSPAVISPHKTLLELTNHTCRWPHGRPGTANSFSAARQAPTWSRGYLTARAICSARIGQTQEWRRQRQSQAGSLTCGPRCERGRAIIQAGNCSGSCRSP